MDYDKDKIARSLKEKLKNFPLYKDIHYIQIIIRNHIHVSYSPTNDRIEGIPMTRFDIEIAPDICYILDFNIEQKERRNGYGRLLANVIENFCIEQFNCKKFVTTPSGLAKKHGFWEKMGFRHINSVEAEKKPSR